MQFQILVWPSCAKSDFTLTLVDKRSPNTLSSDAMDMLHCEPDSEAAECWAATKQTSAALTPATCFTIDFSTADEFGISLNQYRASVSVWSFELHTIHYQGYWFVSRNWSFSVKFTYDVWISKCRCLTPTRCIK